MPLPSSSVLEYGVLALKKINRSSNSVAMVTTTKVTIEKLKFCCFSWTSHSMNEELKQL